jgi:cellobiose-specific phosphotransferase system component IIB
MIQIITNEAEIKSLMMDAVKWAVENLPQSTVIPEQKLDVVSGEELKKRLQISESTLKKYRTSGRIPFILVGGQYRYSYPEVINALTVKTTRARIKSI